MTNSQLCTPWCVWLKFQMGDDKNTPEEYNESLKNVFTIKTYNDLIYYWQESIFNDPKNFLVFQGTDKYNEQLSYVINGKPRVISAINYFRQGIEPSWQDPNNKTGGRLLFNIDKNFQNYQKIYQWLLFYFLGESESCAEDINGIRIISMKSNLTFSFYYRVQVWTKFNNSHTDKAQSFKQTFVKDFFKQFLEGPDSKVKFLPIFKNNEETKQDAPKDNQKQEGGKPKY